LGNGPESIFDRLMEEHGPMLRALLRHLCRQSQDVDDVWQDTAVRVWQSLRKRPWLNNPRGWLAKIAYRAYVDHATRRPTSAEPAGFDCVDESASSPHDTAALAEQRLRVRHALDALSGDLRSLVALHYTAGLSLRETAAALDLAVGTVKSRLHTALAILRRELE
jgi:RNA polymerase sigma-70 factor (ECF subfamily)